MPVIAKLKTRLAEIRERKAAVHGERQKDALAALNRTRGGMLYEGTASANKVAKRRAKNKVAKQSRKVNR